MVSISFIIPTFNTLLLLQRCLKSIEFQIRPEDKIIIIDDGSTDGTKEYLTKKYRNKSNYIVLNQHNSGSGSARNLGLRNAETDYIWFVDADDYLIDNAIDKVKSVLSINNHDILFMGYQVKLSRSKLDVKEVTYNPLNKIELLLTEHFPWNKIIRKDLFRDIYFPNENIRFVDHATMPVIILRANDMGIIREPLYIYDFSHSKNISKKIKKNRDIYIAFRYLEQHSQNNNISPEELEILYIKKFVFDELYNIRLNMRDIYSNAKMIKIYLYLHVPKWTQSQLLKKRMLNYKHIVKFSLWKVLVGKSLILSTFLASIFIYCFLFTKQIFVFLRNLKTRSINLYIRKKNYLFKEF